MLTKEMILNFAESGVCVYDGLCFEVNLRKSSNGDMLSIKLLPVNNFSDPAIFGGGFIEYYKNEDFDELLPALKAAAEKMKKQEVIAMSDEALKLKDLNESDYHCNILIKGIDNRKIYVKQELRDNDGKVFGFQILTANKWSGGYEPSCPINKVIELDGIIYRPVWSFWLDSAVYKVGGDK